MSFAVDSGEGRNRSAARGGFGIRKWTPEYQTWLQTGLEAGRPLEDMASERGGGKVTRHTIAADLIEMVTKGFDGVNPTQIEPHVFDGQSPTRPSSPVLLVLPCTQTHATT